MVLHNDPIVVMTQSLATVIMNRDRKDNSKLSSLGGVIAVIEEVYANLDVNERGTFCELMSEMIDSIGELVFEDYEDLQNNRWNHYRDWRKKLEE